MINNSLDNYINQLQLIAFFSGYPLIYSLVHLIGGKQRKGQSVFVKMLLAGLPFAYALTGTLFLGFMVKNISPDFSIKNIGAQFQVPYLQAWGFLAILFWIPVFNKKPLFTLLHSLAYFFLLAADIFHAFSNNGSIKNEMNIYTASLVLNIFSLAITLLVQLFFSRTRKSKKAF